MAKGKRYPANRLEGLVHGGSLLTEGEDSRAFRVRGSKEVIEWWAGFTPEQRGELLNNLYQGQAGLPIKVHLQPKPGETLVEFARRVNFPIFKESPEQRILNLIHKQGAEVWEFEDRGIKRLKLMLDGKPVRNIQHGTLKRMTDAGQIVLTSRQ